LSSPISSQRGAILEKIIIDTSEKVESAMSLKAGTKRACMVAEEAMNTAKARDPFARYEKL